MLYNGKHRTVSKSECVYKRSASSHSSEIKPSSSQSSSSSSSSSSPSSSSSSLLPRLLLSIEGLDSPSGPTLKPEVVESTLKLEEEKKKSPGERGRMVAVDAETLRSLESEKIINWSQQLRKHYPVNALALSENGKRGSGLLESISLLLWGSDAAASLLCRLLFVMLVEVGQVQLRSRWTRHLKRSHRLSNLDLEWTILVNSVRARNPSSDDSTVPMASNDLQNSLYVFALANILRRPIIIVDGQNPPPPCDSVNESLSGVYLPLLSDASSCSSAPLLLVCHNGCFWPLVEREVDSRDRVGWPFFPVVGGNMEPLLVRFLTQAEEDDRPFGLLKRYLNVRELTLTTIDKKSIPGVLCAALYNANHESDKTDNTVRVSPTTHVLEGRDLTSELQPMESSIHVPSTKSIPRLQKSSLDSRQSTTHLSHAEVPCLAYNDLFSAVEGTCSRPCAAPNCDYFGCWETDWLCSRCHSQKTRGNDHLKRKNFSGHSTPQIGPQVNSQLSSEHSQHASMTSIRCSFPGCNSLASAVTECACYEHLDWLSSGETGRRNSSQSSADHSRSSQHINHNQGGSDSRLENVSGFEKNYMDMISHQEKQIEQSAFKCRSLSCFNFGNSQCRGFCHACHKIMASR